CGTGKGLFRVQENEKAVALLKLDIGPAMSQSNSITTLLEDRHGTLWIGTARDLYRRWPDGSIAHYGIEQGLPDDNIHDLLEDRHGKLWVGTRFGGLIEFSISSTKDPPIIDRIY